MLSDKELKTFPSNDIEAITIMYLQKQDLSDMSPSELAMKYFEVKKEVHEAKVEYYSNKK